MSGRFLSASREGHHHRRFSGRSPNVIYSFGGYDYPFYTGPYWGYPYMDQPYGYGAYGMPYLGQQYMYAPLDVPRYSQDYSYYPYAGPVSVGGLREVQARLAAQGYYEGKVDGLMGPMTRQAIRAYQRDHGLAQTGGVNTALLQELGLP